MFNNINDLSSFTLICYYVTMGMIGLFGIASRNYSHYIKRINIDNIILESYLRIAYCSLLFMFFSVIPNFILIILISIIDYFIKSNFFNVIYFFGLFQFIINSIFFLIIYLKNKNSIRKSRKLYLINTLYILLYTTITIFPVMITILPNLLDNIIICISVIIILSSVIIIIYNECDYLYNAISLKIKGNDNEYFYCYKQVKRTNEGYAIISNINNKIERLEFPKESIEYIHYTWNDDFEENKNTKITNEKVTDNNDKKDLNFIINKEYVDYKKMGKKKGLIDFLTWEKQIKEDSMKREKEDKNYIYNCIKYLYSQIHKAETYRKILSSVEIPIITTIFALIIIIPNIAENYMNSSFSFAYNKANSAFSRIIEIEDTNEKEIKLNNLNSIEKSLAKDNNDIFDLIGCLVIVIVSIIAIFGLFIGFKYKYYSNKIYFYDEYINVLKKVQLESGISIVDENKGLLNVNERRS